MATYTDYQTVKGMLGKPEDKNISQTLIEKSITWASGKCDVYSGKSWTSGEKYYDFISGSCVWLAIAYCRSINEKTEVKQRQEHSFAVEDLMFLKKQLLAEGYDLAENSEDTNVVMLPQTYPMNPNGVIHFQAKRTGFTEQKMTGGDQDDIFTDGDVF